MRPTTKKLNTEQDDFKNLVHAVKEVNQGDKTFMCPAKSCEEPACKLRAEQGEKSIVQRVSG